MSDSRVSRQIYWALRPEVGLKADKDKFVALCELLNHERISSLHVTKEQIERITKECPLQRFELRTKGKATSIRIRPRTSE